MMPAPNILVIDEKPGVRAEHSDILKRAGFAVMEAKNAREAVRRLEGGSVDLILADIQMPIVDGLELLGRLRASSPNIPVIFSISQFDNQFALDAAEFGPVQYLQKPFQPDLLRRSVEIALQLGRRPQRPSPEGGLTVTGSPILMTATKVKNNMGQVLDRVIQGETVLILRHETPKAAVVPITEFEKLFARPETGLDILTRKYDAMLARMQTPSARKGMKTAFDASPKRLGRAAVAVARRRG
jgi:prevent-host-death family protein